ncbi:MAG: CBS domain-containing protein [Pirellulales bacterium]
MDRHREANEMQSANALFSRRLGRWFAAEAGNAVVEYALLLALLAGGLIVGAQFVGWSTSNALGRLDLQTAKAGAARGNLSTAANDAPGESLPPASDAPRFDWMDVASTAGLLMALAACGGAWRFVRKERRIQSLHAQPEEAAPDDPAQVALQEKRRKIQLALAADPSALFDSRLQVRHLMTDRVEAVKPEASLLRVHEVMRQGRRRHLPVCEASGRLVGIISDRDLRKPGRRAADVMTANPCTVAPDMLIVPTVTLLLNNRISCVPVVQNEKLCGLVTTTDLLMALQGALQALQKMPNAVKAMAAVAINEQAAQSLRGEQEKPRAPAAVG